MSLSGMILESVTNLFRIYINWRFIRIFFPALRVKKYVEFIGYALFYVITIGVFLAFQLPAVNLITNLVCFYIIMLLYEGSNRKRILAAILIYSINMVCDFFAYFLFAGSGIEASASQFFSIVTDLLILICELIGERVLGEQAKQEYIRGLSIIITIPVLGIIMLYVLDMSGLGSKGLLIGESFGVLSINIIVFYLYHTYIDMYQKLHEKEVLEQQVKIYSNQLEVIEQTQTKVRSLRHDMRHHIQELRRLTARNEEEETMRYLDKMETAMTNEKEYVYSGNREIDGILNYMLEKANDVLGQVEIEIRNLRNLDEYSFELTVILGNLLDNAIDAAGQTKEQYLRFQMEEEKGVLYIQVANRYCGELVEKDGRLLSTKTGGRKHGFGLKNVQDIVEKNHGTLDIRYDNEMFEVDVVLYLNNLC
ncbi:MAG: GHKL domain-containing protein [Lachnospiraceae bacterium]|nr:GHKL domain-containing protein [Lachnospiraceae bacterium]